MDSGADNKAEKPAHLGPHTPIPDKLYFRIGEVSRLVGVEAHVLRYWERYVTSIKPVKSSSNQRRYRRRDVETFREIKRLLHQERYTLAGVKKRMAARDRQEAGVDVEPTPMLARPVARGLGAPAEPPDEAKKELLRVGLRELIRLAGEEP